MRVKLLSYSPIPQLIEALKTRGIIDPLDMLLPHVSFTFSIEGISRACSHQLVRHRMASYSQQSQRFVEVRSLERHVVVPEMVTRSEEAYKRFQRLVEESQNAYRDLVDLGVPREDARFVLPNTTETNLLLTMDGRFLLHFFGLRCCNRSQWEIRALADAMLREVLKVAPELFNKAGPYCYQRGRCEEGRFSCGQMREVKMKYDKMRVDPQKESA
ncbi:MAG: FAD-dependent thymidylate synthase [Candidatus Bathyarchaeia archaeon]